MSNIIVESQEKFEYMFFVPSKYSYKQNVIDELNKLGAEGWEAVIPVGGDLLMKKKYIAGNFEK